MSLSGNQLDIQLDSLALLREEIEAIGRAASNPPVAPETPTNGPVSFGLPSFLSPMSRTKQVVDEITVSLHALLAKLAPDAMLEDTREGLTVKTAIHFTGRIDSVWNTGLNPESAAVLAAEHLNMLQKTYALRLSFAQTLGVAGGTLLSIALAVANPVVNVPHALASALALKRALQGLAETVEAAG